MKIKTITSVLSFLLFFSCSNEPVNDKSTKKNDTSKNTQTEKAENTTLKDSILFQSYANGLADIKLSIIPDGNFIFHMRTIPQPMTDEKEAIINSGGTWIKKNDHVILHFTKDKPILNAVFDSGYEGENEFKVLDENSVEVNIAKEQLTIWGVVCGKIKG